MSKGFTLGILMREVSYQQAVGDAGNPKSYSFPMQLQPVGDSSQSFIYAGQKQLPQFIRAA